MRVKDTSTGVIADVPEGRVKAWPGRYLQVPHAPTKPKSPKRAASSVSAETETATQKEGKD